VLPFLSKNLNYFIFVKKHCIYPTLTFNNLDIELVTSLKIFGLIIDKRLTFKKHCNKLRKNPNKRLNIVKFLTIKRYFIHPSSLINATRALILSKIDYGLPIYGWCAPSNIKTIYPPYHAAVRRSIGAFPTTPTKCILAKAGLPDINSVVAQMTYKLIPKLMCSTNGILTKDFQTAIKHLRKYKVVSTIRRCVQFSRRYNIETQYRGNKVCPSPPWGLLSSSINTSLHSFTKSVTPKSVFKQLLAKETANYAN